MESEKKEFFAPPMAFQPSVHTATPHDWNALVPVMWLNLTMKKKSKIYKNYMNRKIIQIYRTRWKLFNYLIYFMPVDNVTACQSWSYCTLSNGHFYFWPKKGAPDLFRTHMTYTRAPKAPRLL